MAQGIRTAVPDDAVAVAAFFASVYEGEHGPGSSATLELLQRTVAVLFPEQDAPLVLIHETDEINGVVAVKDAGAHARELVTLQVLDTVQGRGVAQTLLHTIMEDSKAAGVVEIHTTVLPSDVRARGFLRREGFAPEATGGGDADARPLRYSLRIGSATS